MNLYQGSLFSKEHNMGKDLKGKELGSGFTQRKDGLYQARYRDRFGKQKTIYDKKITNLRKEYAIAIAENETCISVREEIILDSWFKRWMNLYKEKSVRPNTIREYTHIYNKNISPYMGNRKICTFVKSDIFCYNLANISIKGQTNLTYLIIL